MNSIEEYLKNKGVVKANNSIEQHLQSKGIPIKKSTPKVELPVAKPKSIGEDVLDYWKILGGKAVGGINRGTADIIGIPRMLSGLATGKEIAPTGIEAGLRNNADRFDVMSNKVVGEDNGKKIFGDLINILSEQIPTIGAAGAAGKVVSYGAKALTSLPVLTKIGTTIATKAPTVANIATKTASNISKIPVVGKLATSAVKSIPSTIGQTAVFTGRSGVGAYDTAREITDDPNKIRDYTFAGMGAEGVPEALEFNMLQNTIKAVSKKNPILGTIGSLLLQGFVNAGQEAATTGLTEIANQKILGLAPNENIGEDMLRDAGYGFAVGLIMTGSGKGLNKLQTKVKSGQTLTNAELQEGVKLIEQETGKDITTLTNEEIAKNPEYLKQYIDKSKAIKSENTMYTDKIGNTRNFQLGGYLPEGKLNEKKILPNKVQSKTPILTLPQGNINTITNQEIKNIPTQQNNTQIETPNKINVAEGKRIPNLQANRMSDILNGINNNTQTNQDISLKQDFIREIPKKVAPGELRIPIKQKQTVELPTMKTQQADTGIKTIKPITNIPINKVALNNDLDSLDSTIPLKDTKNSFIPTKNSIINKISTNSETITQIEDNKNSSIKSIDNKIQDKMFELSQKQNQDTKTATNIKNQIELLEKQKKDIQTVYDSKIETLKIKNDKLSTLDMEIKDTRIDKSNEYRDIAKDRLKTLVDWKDKKHGIYYEVNTMERNFRDIIPDKVQAEKLVDTYITPIDKSEAQKQTFINEYNKKVQELKLNDKEAVATQMLGELKYNSETQLSLETVDNYINENKVDRKKIDNAIEVIRNTYDELFTKVNEVLKAQGYKEISYRKGYFPHFAEQKAQGILSKFAEKLGFKFDTSDLPTDISGITWQLKPGKTWFGNSMQRTGDTTDYNVLKGFDNYIRGASDIIFHTENIQKLRALENEIRYEYADKGVKEQINEIESKDISLEEKNMLLDELYAKIKNGMPNLVSEIRSYTDSLANKKDIHDRGWEKSVDRGIYNTMNALQSRVAANMVGLNISSAMTNFIPITQAWSSIDTKNMGNAVKSTMQSFIKDDGFTDKSVFLTNRNKQADRLFRTKLDKIADASGILFKTVDTFTSNVIVRGKYNENIAKGMSESEAMLNADKFADGVMAGRSKGSLPTQFNKKNPVSKTLNMFQLEVTNQFGFMLKDLPRDKKEEGIKALTLAFFKMFVGAWVYNEIKEKISGSRGAFDPIHFVTSSIETILKEDMKSADKILNIGTEAVKEVPFVGGLLGGGRIPISAALPDGENTLRAATGLVTGEMDRGKALSMLGKEAVKPLAYLLPPFGGGQFKKTVEGLSTISKGGEFGIDSEGKETLKFPVENPNAGDYIKAGVFGKYALPLAKDYVDSGFKSLNAKETQGYKELGIPFKDFKEYAFAKVTKKLEKIDKINSMNIDEDKKWGMYKFDIFSQEIRKEDNSSQLLDAEFAIKNGVSKKEYIDLYNLTQKEDISMPTIKKLTEIFENKSSLSNYIKFKDETSEDKMPSDKDEFNNSIDGSKKNKVRDYLIDSDMSDNDKQFLYSQNYSGNIVEYAKAKTKLSNVKQFNLLNSKSQSEVLETVSSYYDEKDPKSKLKSLQLDWQKEAKAKGIGFEDYKSYRNTVDNISSKGNTNTEVTVNWLRNNKTLTADQRQWIYAVDSKNRTNTNAKLKVAELTGLDVAKYVTYNKAISEISGKDGNGETVANLKKKKVTEYVESLPLKAVEKAIILYSNNYELSQYRSSVAQYISKLKLDDSSKKYILENIGYEIVNNQIQW